MKTKHTKGDWYISGGSQIVSMPSQCKISNSISGWNQEEAEANAKLISAAPELLEACIKAFDMCNSKIMPTEAELFIRSVELKEAIKKATT